jgi:hypothetical protein
MNRCDKCGDKTDNNITRIYGSKDFVATLLCDSCQGKMFNWVRSLDV